MTKIVILNQDEALCSEVIKHTGAEHRRLANQVMSEALERARLSFDDVTFIVATGYGRIAVPFADRQITELACHAKGISAMFPNARLAIDIGGQDSKGLKISRGKLIDFTMSDKCAAGTGRFLEVIAHSLGLEMEDLGGISLKSANKVTISSTCTVFAQQEVVAHLSRGVPLQDIMAGVYDAIASRVARMVDRLKVEPEVVFTGGVAKNAGVVKALEKYLGHKVLIPDEPLLSGAIGAALFARDIVLKALSNGEPVPKGERRLDEATFFN